MDGPQSRSGHCGEQKNLLPLPGIEQRFFGGPGRILVAIPNELTISYTKLSTI